MHYQDTYKRIYQKPKEKAASKNPVKNFHIQYHSMMLVSYNPMLEMLYGNFLDIKVIFHDLMINFHKTTIKIQRQESGDIYNCSKQNK